MPLTFGNAEKYFELQPGDLLRFKKNSEQAIEGIVNEVRETKAVVTVHEYNFPVKYTVRQKSMIRAIQSEDNRKLLKFNFIKQTEKQKAQFHNINISGNADKTF